MRKLPGRLMKVASFIGRLIGVLAFVFVISFVLALLAPKPVPVEFDLSNVYVITANDDVTSVGFSGRPNVRAEPVVFEEKADGSTNSWGRISKSGFTMAVSCVYGTDVRLDANGPFIGIRVEDILSTPEGQNYFPSRIKNDPDGVVWINGKYIEIQ